MLPRKIALIHDWLTGQRGGEKVLEIIAEIFPRAPIYTLFRVKGSQAPEIEGREIHTSFLQKMPFIRTRYRSYLPLYPLAAELFDLQDYDLVISSSHCAAKGVIPRPDALHISYIHSPIRYAWNQYWAYFGAEKLSLFSRLVIPPFMHYLRMWDESSSHRVDAFLANSKNTSQRIAKYYRRPADIVYPPVDTEFFTPGEGKSGRAGFLIVSALVPYKRIDLAIAAFNLTGRDLLIVGQGPDYKPLKKAAKPNVRFAGALPAEDLRRAYREALALILPGEEDFGITALEAQACGTPVIAFGRGGALETVISGKTGLFFPELKAGSLADALDKFSTLKFNKKTVRANALRFSREVFKRAITSAIARKWSEFKASR
jgi:glycosyltransferase involved in cell wall biosynthesis